MWLFAMIDIILQGFELVAMEYVSPTLNTLEEHYKEHRDASFFGDLIDFMTSGLFESNGSCL